MSTVRKKDFSQTGGLKPGRTKFNLSYIKQFDCDMGQLIPIMCDEVIPGDKISVGNEMIVRCLPLVSPVLHQITIKVDYFFCPNRLLWNYDLGHGGAGNWEDFFTGGEDFDDSSSIQRWSPVDNTVGSLWDYMCMPIGQGSIASACPNFFPRNAYNMVYNQYYRDPRIDDEVAEDQDDILYSRWDKDFFTAALESQQCGTAPTIPLSGSADIDASATVAHDSTVQTIYLCNITDTLSTTSGNFNTDLQNALEKMTVDMDSATGPDIASVRYAIQLQRWMERTNRIGWRYFEQLAGRYGVRNLDARLDRMEYLGGTRSYLRTSEVLQTSQTDTTAQGNLAGHGISVSKDHAFKFFVPEFGYILGIMRIVPKAMYHQGIEKQWLRRSRYDFYHPEFVNLSEEAITGKELYADDASQPNNDSVFGYQGYYDELRFKYDKVCGNMRPGESLDFWNLCRDFDSLPSLNSAFIKCDPDKRIFASESDPGFIVQFGNIFHALRPIPYMNNPGLMDHI